MFMHGFDYVTEDRARLLLFCTQVCNVGSILENITIF